MALSLSNSEKRERMVRDACPAPTVEGDKLLLDMRRAGCRFCWYGDADYPSLLLETMDPPCFLLVRGDLPRSPFVMMAGNTNPSLEASLCSYHYGRLLASLGCTVVVNGEGLCDQMACEGSRDGGRNAVVVEAQGLDSILPSVPSPVRVSPFLPGTARNRGNQVARSSVSAGMSFLLLVTEASMRSGVLRIVREALDGGREVALLPSALGRGWRKEGGNRLRSEGCPILCRAKGGSFVLR